MPAGYGPAQTSSGEHLGNRPREDAGKNGKMVGRKPLGYAVPVPHLHPLAALRSQGSQVRILPRVLFEPPRTQGFHAVMPPVEGGPS